MSGLHFLFAVDQLSLKVLTVHSHEFDNDSNNLSEVANVQKAMGLIWT